jgi:hypothetical protein
MASVTAVVVTCLVALLSVVTFVRAALQPQDGPCTIPVVVRGSWFSREFGENTVTDIDPIHMSRRGRCTYMRKYREDDILFVFREGGSSRLVRSGDFKRSHRVWTIEMNIKLFFYHQLWPKLGVK